MRRSVTPRRNAGTEQGSGGEAGSSLLKRTDGNGSSAWQCIALQTGNFRLSADSATVPLRRRKGAFPTFSSLLPPGEGARRADEGMNLSDRRGSFRGLESFPLPHPSLRATFSRREKEKQYPHAYRSSMRTEQETDRTTRAIPRSSAMFWTKRVVIGDGERGLVYRNRRFERVLDARRVPHVRSAARSVDVRRARHRRNPEYAGKRCRHADRAPGRRGWTRPSCSPTSASTKSAWCRRTASSRTCWRRVRASCTGAGW